MIKTYIDGVLQSATSHEDLTNILQAGIGVTNGHISDGMQTIYGAKTFNTPITSTTANLTNSTNKNLVTDVEKTAITHSNRTALDSVSGTNTGDETTSTILTKIGDGSKINSTYLPSYVDDVLEYASLANFPLTGETGKIYVALNTNLTYRWSGSAYVEISPSLALGETSTTAYRGDRGASAYAHSIITDGSNPHSTTFANIASKPTTISGYGITNGVTLTGTETLTNKTLTSPVLDGVATGTAITTTGEASKLFKFSSTAKTALHELTLKKSSTTALRIQNDSGVNIFNVDTVNNTATINGKLENNGDVTLRTSGSLEKQGKRILGVPIYGSGTPCYIEFRRDSNLYDGREGRIIFATNNGTNPSPTERMIITGIGTVIIPTLAGTGNRAVYSDAIGTLTNSSSDVRVKKNIENITENMNVLDVLKNIRGVTYNWDNTIEGYEGAGEQQEIGVIAQEIEQHIPQIVGENSTGYKSVDYAKIS